MATPSEKCEFSQVLWDLSLFLKLSHSALWTLSSVARIADFFWTLKFKSKAFFFQFLISLLQALLALLSLTTLPSQTIFKFPP